MVRGEFKRGVLIAVGILGLVFQGLFIGGIDAIDSKEDRWWYVGQAIVGPLVWGINAWHQAGFKAYDIGEGVSVVDADRFIRLQPRTLYPGEQRVMEDIRIVDRRTRQEQTERIAVVRPLPDGDTTPPPNEKGLARMNEVGTLSITIAGILNLIVILDSLIPGRKNREDAAQKGGAA